MQRFIVVAALLAAAASVHARTWHVPADAPTIQAGIDSALVGDVVALAAGTYHELGLVMKSGVTLLGDGGFTDAVILDAQHAGPLMIFEDDGSFAATRIEHLTFANADSSALTVLGSGDLTVTDCAFTGNTAAGSFAPAVQVEGHDWGALHFVDCLFADNANTGSGGVCWFLGCGESVQFERCLFVRNHSGQWGAVSASAYSNGNGPAFDQCTFTANTGAGSWTALFLVTWGGIRVTRSVAAYNEVRFATTGSGHLGSVVWECNDLFANAGDDYSGWDMDDGNFSADPCFCDPDFGDYHLAADSWCLPGHHPWGCDDLVGAFGVGCAAVGCDGPVAVESHSWSAVKELFR